MDISSLTDGLLLTAGPINKTKKVLEVSNKSVYMRTAEFRVFTIELACKVKRAFNADIDDNGKYEVSFVTCSGTGAMQLAVENTNPIHPLIISNGHFGDRWLDIIKYYNKDTHINYTKLSPHNGCNASYKEVAKIYNRPDNFDVVFITYCESSTGQLQQDLGKIVNLVHDHNGIVVLDNVSGSLVNPLDLNKISVDLMITASQKAIGADPGMAIIIYNNRVLSRSKSSIIKSLYFDLESYYSNSLRGSTPFTPPTNIMMQAYESLTEYIRNESYLAEVTATTAYLRSEMKRLGFSITTDESTLGNCITEFKLPILLGINSNELVDKLINSGYHIVPSDNGRKVRVCNFNITISQVKEFIKALSRIIDDDLKQ